jgi:tetratricopeptide (TPR) repeat protein
MRILSSKAAQTESTNPLLGELCGTDSLKEFPSVGQCGLAQCRYVVYLLLLTGALFFPLFAGAQSTGIVELDDALEVQLGGHLKEAIQAYTEVIKNHPRSAEAYNWRGMAYGELGELDKALADFNQAVDISPNYADAFNNRGEIYRKKKQYPQAEQDYKKAASIEPSFAEAYYNLGLVYEHGMKNDSQAAGAYESYLKHNPQARDREAVSEKITALKKAATAKPAVREPGKPAGPPGAKPAPGTPPSQVQKPQTAQAPGAKPGVKPGERPGAKPGLPATPGVTPQPGPQLPIDLKDMPFGNDLGSLIPVLMGMGVILIVIPVVIYLFFAIMLFLIARKTNTSNAWFAFIPIAQYVLMLNVAGKPIWWIVAFLLPILASALTLVDPSIASIASIVGFVVSMIAWLLVSLGIASARNKSAVWGVLLFLPCTSPIALIYLALSK